NVAVRRVQHSDRFGHLALSQTVSSPSSATRLRVNDIPLADGIGLLSQGGSRRVRSACCAMGWCSACCGSAAPLPRTVRLGRTALPRRGGIDMRENLALDHRVVAEDVMMLDAENLFQPAHQGLTHLGHCGMPLAPGLHGRVSKRPEAITRL